MSRYQVFGSHVTHQGSLIGSWESRVAERSVPRAPAVAAAPLRPAQTPQLYRVLRNWWWIVLISVPCAGAAPPQRRCRRRTWPKYRSLAICMTTFFSSLFISLLLCVSWACRVWVFGCKNGQKTKPETFIFWGAFDSAKNHKRQRRNRQSVTAKREKSQTP